MAALKCKMAIKIIILVSFIVGIAVAFHLIFSTHGMTLVAQGNVAVYQTEKQAMTWPHPEPMAELSPGQSVSLTECVDMKSDMVYKIRLPDGRYGFVLDGKYLLMKNGKPTCC